MHPIVHRGPMCRPSPSHRVRPVQPGIWGLFGHVTALGGTESGFWVALWERVGYCGRLHAKPGWQGSSHPATRVLNSVSRMRSLDLSRNLRTRARREAPADDPRQVPRGARQTASCWPPRTRWSRSAAVASRCGRPEAYDAYHAADAGRPEPASPKARELKRFFFNASFDTELDTANRVMIPPHLMSYAGLEQGGRGDRLGRVPGGMGPQTLHAELRGRADPDPRHRSEPWRHYLT